MDMEVRNSAIGYNANLKTVKNNRKIFELSDKIYQTALIKYNEGVGSSVEVRQPNGRTRRTGCNLCPRCYFADCGH